MSYSLAGPATAVTVSTTAVALYTAPTSTGYYRDLVITNQGPAVLYVGQSAMTAATSQYLPVPVGQSLILSGPVETVYGIGTASTVAWAGLASVLSVT